MAILSYWDFSCFHTAEWFVGKTYSKRMFFEVLQILVIDLVCGLIIVIALQRAFVIVWVCARSLPAFISGFFDMHLFSWGLALFYVTFLILCALLLCCSWNCYIKICWVKLVYSYYTKWCKIFNRVYIKRKGSKMKFWLIILHLSFGYRSRNKVFFTVVTLYIWKIDVVSSMVN